MIDPHVHLRDWGQSGAETIVHALGVAVRCGFTHVFDMPNTAPCTVSDFQSLADRLETAEKSKVPGIEYHTYIGLTGKRGQALWVSEAYDKFFPKAIGLKLFAGPSTGNLEVSDKASQAMVFEELAESGYKGVLAVHCEDKTLFRPELYDGSDFSTHSLVRPPESEFKCVENVIDTAVAHGFGGILHIAHVSCAESVAIIKRKRLECPEIRITFGVTPHHALLTCEDAKDHSRLLKVNPPLRSLQDRDAVFGSLLDGTADWIESDHAPHVLSDKVVKGASGLPGFAGYLLLVGTLRRAGISENRLKGLICRNAAGAFGIPVSDDDCQIPEDLLGLCRTIQAEYGIPAYDL